MANQPQLINLFFGNQEQILELESIRKMQEMLKLLDFHTQESNKYQEQQKYLLRMNTSRGLQNANHRSRHERKNKRYQPRHINH